MKLALLVYLASIAGNIATVLILFGVGLLIAIALMYVAIMWCDDCCSDDLVEEAKQRASNYTKPFLITAIVCFTIATFIPSERTFYLMAGAYATEQIASNERVQKIGSDVLEVIETKLTELKETEK
ncbi:hypothetical protein J658_0040 [Acinetobacter baumannii 573719]|nr:hypothetical protein J658_0040 [Acinetobacter baumannii 573719]